MQKAQRAIFLFCTALAASPAIAQQDNCAYLREHEKSPLTVWVVAAPVPRVGPPDISTYREQTAGSFGTASSNVGTPSSNHGQTAGSLGHAASDVGTASSNHGQTSGSFGASAGDVGVSASDTGQTVGSFGDNLDTIATAGDRPAPPGIPTGNGGQPSPLPIVNMGPDDMRTAFQHAIALPGLIDLRVNYVTVPPEKLAQRLSLVRDRDRYPDLLIGAGLTASGVVTDASGSLTRETYLIPGFTVQRSSRYEDNPGGPGRTLPPILLLTNAPHPEAARALLIGLSERTRFISCRDADMDDDGKAPAEIALNMLDPMRRDGRIRNWMDVEGDEYLHSNAWIPQPPLPPARSGHPDPEQKVRVDVLESHANDRLAVVTLRVVYEQTNGFFVYHPLVILRKNSDGDWKVLHITPDLEMNQLREAVNFLEPYTREDDPDAKVGSISQASPPNNDNRQPVPELWWDNGTGARLLVVEWHGTHPQRTRLFFVTDTDPREQTRVRALFARDAGQYTWRVWSIGDDGVMSISPWRSFNVLP